ncbi:hypothetical protein K8R47_03190, partial [archaeon]|nr:hypothetical protein [archaeon]
TDLSLLIEYTAQYPNLIVIEYEIYHSQASNYETANKYFQSYVFIGRAGVPFLIFNKDQTAMGRFEVLDSNEIIKTLDSNKCPLEDGSSVDFKDLDITNLNGKVNIWTKNKILISDGSGVGNNELLKKLLTEEEISSALKEIEFEEIFTNSVYMSGSEIKFEIAVKMDGWTLQWNDDSIEIAIGISEVIHPKWKNGYWFFIVILLAIISFFVYWIGIAKRKICIYLGEKQKDYLIIGISLITLIGFFILAKNISPDFLEKIGYNLPLPIFTFIIALVDGFNPCNLFVLTFLLGLLASVSHSRKRIYTIGFTFVFVVFIIYFLFMVAWLNIFKYIGFITPLRIAIASIALIAGIINCKELLFFRKGITLMIQERHKGLLVRKIESMKEIIKKASLPVLISASIGLAAFASLVELPCTAGFPIIYTAILSGKMLSGLSYYFYLGLYNLIYVIPLAVIITIFGYSFKTKQISKRQMQIIKFIGGLIMILLGLVLLINPSLIGIGFG